MANNVRDEEKKVRRGILIGLDRETRVGLKNGELNFINGVVVGRVEGNFGEESIISIEAASPAMTTMPSAQSSISTQADSPTMAPVTTTP